MTIQICGVTDDEIRRFAEGGAVELEGHVASCEHCQATLEGFWSSELRRDLSPAVLRTLELDAFFRDAVGMAAGVGAALVRALVTYMGIGDEEDDG